MTVLANTSGASYRIGIDVGGTFTKAVMIDGLTQRIVARSSVHTTHADERGVARGVIEVFQQVLRDSKVPPQEIVFLAHSTTQATNALLEGDTARVGVLGTAPGRIAKLAEKQVRVDPIELSAGKFLATSNRFVVSEAVTRDEIASTVRSLVDEGVEVIVASAAFGVDDASTENLIRESAAELDVVATCGHDITQLYGLSVRTKTAVVNASILPKMIATANMTEKSVRETGIEAPLMIMRGDGGVMNIEEMRRRPALTMLSGPAASVAGALMHAGMSDGIYFEVGGTSTNIGVVSNGRPSVAYARVGGHETYVNSLDIRVLGIGGGSLVRVRGGQIVDVGPRSAHIAGLPYAAFADPAVFDGARLVLFEPGTGEGEEFVAVETVSGVRYAVTTTCAANALGTTDPEMHSFADPAAARKAIAILGRHLGVDADTVATAILDRAISKIAPVLDTLADEYGLDLDQRTLIGVGGGVGSLVRHLGSRTGHRFVVPQDAEVISSIGAALAMVREVVERIVSSPKPADLLAVRKEALAAAMRLGADEDTIDVSIEIDRATNRIRAVAIGAAKMKVKEPETFVDSIEARHIAASVFEVSPADVHLRAEIPGMRVFSTESEGYAPVRVIDHHRRVRVQRSAAQVSLSTARDCAEQMTQAHLQSGSTARGRVEFPGGFVLYMQHIIDLCSVDTIEQATSLVQDELGEVAPDTPVILIWLHAES